MRSDALYFILTLLLLVDDFEQNHGEDEMHDKDYQER